MDSTPQLTSSRTTGLPNLGHLEGTLDAKAFGKASDNGLEQSVEAVVSCKGHTVAHGCPASLLRGLFSIDQTVKSPAVTQVRDQPHGYGRYLYSSICNLSWLLYFLRACMDILTRTRKDLIFTEGSSG